MGINVQIQDEDGHVIETLHDAIPEGLEVIGKAYDALNFPLISGIDPYRDTIFNGLQMPQFLREGSARSEKTQQKPFMTEVFRLAQRCLNEVHVYLAFIGD